MAAKEFTKTADESDHFRGTHEVQECLEGEMEADLHTHLANCKKNPGHTGFIPVKKFRKEHLPPGYQDISICDVIDAYSYLTVRIAVEFTSPNRPDFVFGTKDPYPFHKIRGKNSLRTGTGAVWSVKSVYDRPCPCPVCQRSARPHRIWYQVWVSTVRHVIFDSTEARQSSCRLWFDDDQSPVVKMYGWKATGISLTDQDWCTMVCATHDLVIGEKLLNVIWRFDEVWGKVKKKYGSKNETDKLAIIVSHPHGCSKQVSVGRWIDRHKVPRSPGYTRYTYTTCTCPGSSGAPVYRLGWGDHQHTGVNSRGINYSSAKKDMDFSYTGEDLNQIHLFERNIEVLDTLLAFSDDASQSVLRF